MDLIGEIFLDGLAVLFSLGCLGWSIQQAAWLKHNPSLETENKLETQEMSHSEFLDRKILLSFLGRLKLNRNPIDQFDPALFDSS